MSLSPRLSSRHTQFIVQELKNITSEIHMVDRDTPVEVVRCDRSSITLAFENISALVGHLVSIKGIFKFGDDTTEAFAVVGRITQINAQYVEIKMNQYDIETWGKFIKQINQKQQRVDKLFKSIKGED
tara:strand:- start:173542 stop:173925 length:384 start_codon:yes stop_codon:yes gene_type:complete